MLDTIAAIATPPGKGGVAIIRISGKKAKSIAEKITHKTLIPRFATYSNFYSMVVKHLSAGITDKIIDNGIMARGNAAFFISARSNTIEGVALVSDIEKKFHTKRPIKR